jgi:hypothetical protein
LEGSGEQPGFAAAREPWCTNRDYTRHDCCVSSERNAMK